MSLLRGEFYLGLDVGTQSTKAVVVDVESDSIVARAQFGYGLIEGLPEGGAEQHPHTWWDAVRAVCAELRESIDLGCVRGIGVSGQQHGFVPLDSNGHVLRPAKLWCDTLTASEAAELSELWGRAVPTGFTASKILWMKRERFGLFKHLATVALPHDYINFRLSGERFTEAGDASGTGFFDPVHRDYRRDDVAAIDERLPDALLPIVQANQSPAALSAEAASELGMTAGIPVAPGGGDNMMSAIGSGAIEPGLCVVSLGTSGTVFGFADETVSDPGGLIAPFCDSTGGHLPLLCTMNVTGVTESIREVFGSAHDHASLTAAAQEIEPGCEGVLFVPFLQGERVPDLPHARGSLHGIGVHSLRPGVLYRAAIEGTSLNLAAGVERMRALGLRVERVRLVGGGAHNPLWCQVIADTLDAEVQRLAEPESAALGAALQASWVSAGAADRASLRALVDRFVVADGEPIRPEPASVSAYREVAVRFAAAVQREWG